MPLQQLSTIAFRLKDAKGLFTVVAELSPYYKTSDTLFYIELDWGVGMSILVSILTEYVAIWTNAIHECFPVYNSGVKQIVEFLPILLKMFMSTPVGFHSHFLISQTTLLKPVNFLTDRLGRYWSLIAAAGECCPPGQCAHYVLYCIVQLCLLCFDAVGWAAGRASGL